MLIFDAYRPILVEKHSVHQRSGLNCQIRPMARLSQIRHGRALSASPPDRRFAATEPFLISTIAVLAIGNACGSRGLGQNLMHLPGPGHPAYRKWTISAVIGSGTAPMRLHLLEIGKHIGKRPTSESVLAPKIIVEPIATNMDHPIDGRRAPQNAATINNQTATVKGRFRLGSELPDQQWVCPDLREGDRHFEKWMPVTTTRFQQQHAHVMLFGQPGGENCTRRAGPNNNVVVFCKTRRHQISPSRVL